MTTDRRKNAGRTAFARTLLLLAALAGLVVAAPGSAGASAGASVAARTEPGAAAPMGIGGCGNGIANGFNLRACISRSASWVYPDFYVNAVPAGAPNCVILAWVYRNGTFVSLTSHPCAVGYRGLNPVRATPGNYYVRLVAYVSNVPKAEAYSPVLSV